MSPYVYPGTFEVIRSKKGWPLTTENIIGVVAAYYKMDRESLDRKSRKDKFVRARHMSWHFIRKYITSISLSEMGRLFGDYDHTTVIHGIQAIRNGMDTKHEAILFEAIHIEAIIKATIQTGTV